MSEYSPSTDDVEAQAQEQELEIEKDDELYAEIDIGQFMCGLNFCSEGLILMSFFFFWLSSLDLIKQQPIGVMERNHVCLVC